MAMPIEPISGASPAAVGARPRRRQSGFAVPDAGEADAASAPAEASSATPVPVLTLQADEMAETAAAADREAAKQGNRLLGAMTGLQLAMLSDAEDGGQAALSELATCLPQAADPALNDVLRAIAQRAEVERARRV